MRLAGNVRNVDITLKLVSKLGRTAGLQSRLRRRRSEAGRLLVDNLKRLAAAKFPEPADPPPARKVLDHAVRRFVRRAQETRNALRLHRLRIAAKKLRYTLELVAPDHPRMDEIKQIQTQLGDINDYETARAIVKEESGAKSIRDQLKRKQERRMRKFRAAWSARFPSEDALRMWIGGHPEARRPKRRVRSS